jgi:hypothetical protein
VHDLWVSKAIMRRPRTGNERASKPLLPVAALEWFSLLLNVIDARHLESQILASTCGD